MSGISDIPAWIAVDLGAESGRVVVVWIDRPGDRFARNEVFRFSNRMLALPGGLYWNIGNIWQCIVDGLRAASDFALERRLEIRSVGVDAWGVDWVLLDESGELLGLPHAYRDPRNLAACDRLSQQISLPEVYGITGIQHMPINSLYSLHAMNTHSPVWMQTARRLLFLPDLMHYWLSGIPVNEATIASTSQLLDLDGNWSSRLMDLAGLPESCVAPVVTPGTEIGTLRKEICDVTGLDEVVRVILPPSHDTASAIASIPAGDDSSWCFLSSGTWSLLGAEIESPCVNEQAARYMFTNEAGVQGTTRFLKNISGLWLIQQCRQEFAALDSQQELSYADMQRLAESAAPFRTLVNPDDPAFAQPGGLLKKIGRFALATGQPAPESPGSYLRCCLESLALTYRRTLNRLEESLDESFEIIHMVGGGCQNALLCQMTADATGRRVIAGPVEATAIGNALVQAMGDQSIADLSGLRAMVRNTVQPETREPQNQQSWPKQADRFDELMDDPN